MAEDSIAEIWRPVQDHPGYEVSDRGRVRRGTHIKKLTLANNGYLVVNLGHNSVKSVHRLVCAAFHGAPPEGKSEVAHWDGVKTNNWASNLRWASGKENSSDSIRHGRTQRGRKNRGAVLTESLVREIRKMLADAVSQAEIARRLELAPWLVWDVAQRKTWAWLD